MTDADVIRLYRRGLTLRAMAERLGVAHWATVQQRVQTLMRHGLLDYGNRSRRPWTAESEAELIGLWGWYPEQKVALRMGRSLNAVRMKAKRLGLSRQWKGAYTARDVGRIFEVDSKSVRIWIDRGYLRGSRSDVRCGGTRKWWIEHEAIEAFICEHADRYELRRITEPYWRIRAERAIRGQVVNVREAARIVGCCEATILRRIRCGEWPAERAPGAGGYHWRLRRSDLLSFRYWHAPVRLRYAKGRCGALGKAS